MGISLSGVESWTPNDQLEPGTYVFRAGETKYAVSSNGHPQVQIDWAVVAGTYKGAEQRDWVTFTERSLGNVAMVLDAAGVTRPPQEFDDYEAMAYWFAAAIKGKTVEGIVRLEPSRKDPDKEWPTIKGYRPVTSSDVPSDGFGERPAVKSEPLPF